MNILVLNCGSSSAKYKLIEVKHNHTDKLDLEQDRILIDNWILSGAGGE